MIMTRKFYPFFCLILFVFLGCAEQRAYRHLDRAVAHEADGDYEWALAAFQAAVEVCPDDAVLHRWLGRAHLRRNQYEDAQAEFKIALSLAPDYLVVYRDLAIVSEALKMPDTAVMWLEKAVARVPAYEEAYRDLISLYLSHDRLTEGQVLLEEVIVKWPEAIWAHFQLGGLYLALKWPDRAEEAFAHVLAIDPRNKDEEELHTRALGELGNVYYECKDYEQAQDYYKEALKRNPLDDSNMNNLAWVYAIQGIHLREGIRLSRRSLRLRPQTVAYMDTLAELYYKAGNRARAVQIIRQAIALDPQNPELRAHLHRQLAKFTSGGQGKV